MAPRRATTAAGSKPAAVSTSTRPALNATATLSTPGNAAKASLTRRAQPPQVMPPTAKAVIDVFMVFISSSGALTRGRPVHYTQSTMDALTQTALAAALGAERQRFLQFVTRHTGDPEAAEEVLHDAIIQALARVEQLNDPTRWQAWFFRIVRNTLIDRARRVRRERDRTAALDTDTLIDDQPAPRAPCTCVLRVTERLKPEYRDALNAVTLGTTSVKDWADTQGISANNAGVRIHRARAALKSALVETCGRCADDGCRDCDCGPDLACQAAT